MRRAEAILVIIALLAIPLALLARGGACQQTTCMCCLLHGANGPHGKTMSCSHCAGHGQCGLSSAHDFGLHELMAPTAPAAAVRFVAPDGVRRAFVFLASTNVEGFVSAPFNPPRA